MKKIIKKMLIFVCGISAAVFFTAGVTGFAGVKAQEAAEEVFSGNNVIENGGFEYEGDSAYGWSFKGKENDATTGYATVQQEDIHSGNFAMRFSVDGGTSDGSIDDKVYVIYNSIPVEHDSIYLFSAWVKISEASDNLMFSSFASNAEGYNVIKWTDYFTPSLTENCDWTEVTALISVSEGVSDGAISVGLKAYRGTATVYVDDLSLVKVARTSTVGYNLDFEKNAGGNVYNWTAMNGKLTADSISRPDGKGKYSAKLETGNSTYAYINSQALPVKSATYYEMSLWVKTEGAYAAYSEVILRQYDAAGNKAYGVIYDNSKGAEKYYQGDPSEKKGGAELIRPFWINRVYANSEWRRVSFFFRTADTASDIVASLYMRDTQATAWFDDVTIKEVPSADVEGLAYATENNNEFEAYDEDGFPLLWNLTSGRSYKSSLKVDKERYHGGKSSAYFETESLLEQTRFESSALIPVKSDTIYEISAFYSSKNCDPTATLRFDVFQYDENGNPLYDSSGNKLTIVGTKVSLSGASVADEWKKIYTRVSAANKNVRYISFAFLVSPGRANIWIDDVAVTEVENEDGSVVITDKNDFHAVDSDGNLSGWTLEKTKGNSSLARVEGEDGYRGKLTVDGGATAKISTKIKSFFNGYTYNVTFGYSATSAATLQIRFYGVTGKEIVGTALDKEIIPSDDYVNFSYGFTSPSATYAIVSVKSDGASELTIGNFIIYETAKPASKASWDGHWVWYNENPVEEAVKEYRYFRYEFVLPEEATYAPLQIAVDDKFKLYVNGLFIDNTITDDSYTFGNVKVYFLEDYLKKGKNVFAIKAYNRVSEAGVLFDGKFTLADATVFIAKSDTTVKTSKTVVGDVADEENETVPAWATKDFDDSLWRHAKDFGAPPVSPWGSMFYKSSLYIENKIEILSVKSSSKVTAGNVITFTVKLKPVGQIGGAFSFKADLYKRNTTDKITTLLLKITSGESDATKWKPDEPVELKLEMKIPAYLDADYYDLRLDTSNVTIANMFTEDDRFIGNGNIADFTVEKKSGADDKLIATVEEYNGVPTLMINGVPQSPVMYLRPDLESYLQTDAESYISESTFNLYITYQGNIGNGKTPEQLWKEDGSIDFEKFDQSIKDLLAVNGDGLVMVNIGMHAPDWWLKQNPGHEVYSDKAGVNTDKDIKSNFVSFASEKYKIESGEILSRLIAHMKTQSYYNRVYGIKLSAGEGNEMMTKGSGAYWMPDYSDVAKERFKSWVKDKYKTISVLQEAYNDYTITFDDVNAPSFDDRLKSSDDPNTIYDAKTQRLIIDYNLFLNDMSTDCLLYWAKITKESVENEKIVGAYNGYVWVFGSYDGQAKTHSFIQKVLKSEYIDFIASPINYNERTIGESSTFMAMIDSAQAYGKLYIAEQDNRTFLTDGNTGYSWNAQWDGQVGETHTPEDTINQYKRDFANTFVNGVGYWYYDMQGGWINDKQIYDLMAEEKRIYDNSLKIQNKSYLNEVAVFVDDYTYSYAKIDTLENSPHVLFDALFVRQRLSLAKMGCGYDTYYMSSLADGKVKPHKVNIFLSPFEITEKTSAAIDKYIKTDGQYAVWIYLPGVSTGSETSLENMEKVTGFSLGMDYRKAALQVKITNGNNNITKGLADTYYGSKIERNSPVAYIEDEDAEILGVLIDGNKNGLGVKRFDNWTSIYSSGINLSVGLLRGILKEAGVHLYSENTDDVIYSNNRYVSLHSAVGGTKKLTLTGKYDVYDEFAGKYIATDTDVVEFSHLANDTKIFRLDPVGSARPSKNKTSAWGWALGGTISGLALAGAATFIIIKRKKRIV